MKFYEPKGKNRTININIPDIPGVYMFWTNEEIIYIGESENLRKRIASHFYCKTVDISLIKKVSIIICKDKLDTIKIEKRLIELIPTEFNNQPFCSPFWNKSFYKSFCEPKYYLESNPTKALESYEKLF